MTTPSRPDGHAMNTSSACANADVGIETASAAKVPSSIVAAALILIALDLQSCCVGTAMDADGQVRVGGDVAELTGLLNLSRWPDGMRVIVRRERPHPGA